MTTINAVIVEDVIANRDALLTLLAQECKQVSVIGSATGVETGVELIANTNPDLVFLDIEYKDGTGFDLLHQLKEQDKIDFGIIFFTANGNYDYAIQAIEYSALDFINKPVDANKLCKAVEKATNLYNKEEMNGQLSLLFDRLDRGNSNRKRIAVHLIKSIIEFIEIESILYLEADGILTHFHTTDKQVFKATKNMGAYSKLLLLDHDFFQISNSLVVNLNHIKRYNHSDYAVHLKSGQVLTASRRGGQDFRKYLNNLNSPLTKSPTSLSSLFSGLLKRF